MNYLTTINNTLKVLEKAYKGKEKEIFDMFYSAVKYYYSVEAWGFLDNIFDDIIEYAEFTEDESVIFLVKNDIAECRMILSSEIL